MKKYLLLFVTAILFAISCVYLTLPKEVEIEIYYTSEPDLPVTPLSDNY